MSLAGRLAYQLVLRPLGALRTSIRAGGPVEQWRTARGEAAMRAAVETLPPPQPAASSAGAPALELHLLTGRRFWHQTAFCLWSFARCSSRALAPVIHDDGSLDPTGRAQLQRLFPALRVREHRDALQALHVALPPARFPTIHERWRNYPHLRKLTAPHLDGGSGYKLVLDSDLLFFRNPALLTDWLDRPARPLHAVDTENAYGYPLALMSELAGATVADRVNVGLTGLASEALDWEKLEHWSATLIARHGTHYYLEQALVAMLVAGRSCTVAPARDYVTGPVEPEAAECRAVMHHYVAGSKKWYFRRNWERTLAAPAPERQ